MKKSNKMSASALRNLLATTLVIVIIGTVVGFYFGLQIIRSYALEVTHAITDSHASGQSVGDLRKLQQELTAGQGLVTKADKIFSSPETYQTQALKDITKYADEAGVTISSIDSATSNGSSAAPTTNHAEIITLKSPVSYAKFLKFLDGIEGNLPKMQVTGITIARPTVPSGDMITTDKITITVATR